MPRTEALARWDVPSADMLRRLANEPLPLGLKASPGTRTFVRDVYYDTPDHVLRSRGVTCRVRYRTDGRQELSVTVSSVGDGQASVTRAEADIPGGNIGEAMQGASEPARMLRAIVNPSTLSPQLELEIERHERHATTGWLVQTSFELEYDIVTVRASGLSRSFHEIALRIMRPGRPSAEQLSQAMIAQHSLRTMTIDRRERAEQMRAALESEALARGVGEGRWVVVAAIDGKRIATIQEGSVRRLPSAEGSGEEACRHLLRKTLGSTVGDLHLVSTTHGSGRLRTLEVWSCSRVDRSATPAGAPIIWMPMEELLAAVGAQGVEDAPTLAALAVLSRSDLLPWLVSMPSAKAIEARTQERQAIPSATVHQDPLPNAPSLDAEESLLAFNERVLALAEDASMPLLERIRFIAIVSSNVDEFFSVRVGGLKFEGRDVSDENSSSVATDVRLALLRRRARELALRQHECTVACLAALATHGVRVSTLAQLNDEQRLFLKTYFRSTVFPYLTPRAITATPGHSLPVVADRMLSFVVALRTPTPDAPLQIAELAVPAALPRFIPLPGATQFVPLEDLIRDNLPILYPGRRVESAHLFRVTRYATVEVDETRVGNLVQAMEERTAQRRHQPVVRIEVEEGMPANSRSLLLRELHLEPGARPGFLGESDILEVRGLMDLEALRELANLPMSALSHPPFVPRQALSGDRNFWEILRQGDVLMHHPYDDFGTSVVRFFEEAANDPGVATIKVALYRAGDRSPIVDALRRAAGAGKDVTVFVELKARFDEQRNVRWTRQMEAAGVHVVHGLPGFKNHSKIALVVRTESDGPRRYAHIGTGNYNASTARLYTDLGVLTSRDAVCDDVADLFNILTGSSVPADVSYRECLVASTSLLSGIIERIDREAEHVRAGRGGRIRLKVNGLSDRAVVHALYRASQAGVEIDLLVRGVCTLSPGVPGFSDRIRVVSVLGRFLEHARIYAFDNAGEPDHFIGSADLRPRNLRRRVEVLVPILEAAQRSRLDAILDAELRDPTAWELGSDGKYTRRAGATASQSVQLRFMEAAAQLVATT